MQQVRGCSKANRNISTAVKDGLFREEFYERLESLLAISPLRALAANAPLLISHFAQRMGFRQENRITPIVRSGF